MTPQKQEDAVGALVAHLHSWHCTVSGTPWRPRACHRLLADAVTQNRSAKVLSALAHAGGELPLADGDVAQACVQFGRTVDLLQGITVPFEHALSQLRLGVALAKAGEQLDMHVRNVLTKLDCTSRVAAAQRAAELGLLEPVAARTGAPA
jgi:hypothetical protein